VQIDNSVWLLLINITTVLALSLISYKFLKNSTLYSKVSECKCKSTLSQFVSSVSIVFINRYLTTKRMIKTAPDDDSLHHPTFLHFKLEEDFCEFHY